MGRLDRSDTTASQKTGYWQQSSVSSQQTTTTISTYLTIPPSIQFWRSLPLLGSPAMVEPGGIMPMSRVDARIGSISVFQNRDFPVLSEPGKTGSDALAVTCRGSHLSRPSLVEAVTCRGSHLSRQSLAEAAFHYCWRQHLVSTELCANGTLFNEQFQVCDHFYNVRCGSPYEDL
ncbi:unnamed protein product [Spodoptera exigua]|nr:unnamed protein product [Spodoptera exigua]